LRYLWRPVDYEGAEVVASGSRAERTGDLPSVTIDRRMPALGFNPFPKVI
jgi:hypothetical protein